jgi:protein-tyrosine phosphatase
MARILFVCLGNICRSPTAEGTMRALVHEAGLEDEIELDSAGTGGWHIGEPPDERAVEAAQARGIALEGQAREVTLEDFDDFDLLVAMDRSNLGELWRLAPSEQARSKVRLLREFDPANPRPLAALSDNGGSKRSRGGAPRVNVKALKELDVPDPYYGAAGGFEEVLDLVQRACEGLLEEIRRGEVA